MRPAPLAVLLLVLAAAPSAQTAAPAYERGVEAYRAGDYAEAVRQLERAVEAAPDDPEAHYLLARVLFDPRNPRRDEGRASRALGGALRLDPENVVYLVARLEQLRGDTWNLIQELFRLQRRHAVAKQLLAIDSTNAFAHEELGLQAIVDYYQFRNAIKFPSLEYRGELVAVAQTANDLDAGLEPQLGDIGPTGLMAFDATPMAESVRLESDFGGDIADRFDVEALRAAGVPETGYAPRAQAAYDRAIYHLRRALDADPRRRDVYDHMVRLAVLSGRYEAVLPDLTEMYVQFADDAAMWLYTGMVNHRLGQYEGAEVAFDQALERMDPETAAAYTDLTLILPEAEWPAFRADPAAFADRYWASRDPRFLNDANERRTEHYARLVEADLLYRSEGLGIPGWRTERGKLYLRYGPPATDVIIDGGFQTVVERLALRAPDATPPAERPAGPEVVNRFNVWDYGDGTRFVFEDPGRNGQFRLYSLPADLYGLASVRHATAMDYAQIAEDEVRARPERYAFRAPGRQVELPYRVAAFKGDDGRTDLYVNYGIPVAETGPPGDGVQEDVDVTVRTGAFLIAPTRELLVERRRTVYGLRGAQIVPFEQTRLWTSTEALSALPGDGYEVSLEFETASGQTSAVQRRAVDVPAFTGDRLQLSDVLLAYHAEEADRAAPGRVFRDGVSVQPAPWGVFRAGDPVYLFFEAYGLGLRDGRSDYEVEATLRTKDTSRGLGRLAKRLFGGRAPAVSSAFEVQGDRPDDTVYLFLDATGQEPGLYTLTVTVRDRVTGAEADRETDLFLE